MLEQIGAREGDLLYIVQRDGGNLPTANAPEGHVPEIGEAMVAYDHLVRARRHRGTLRDLAA